MADTLALRRRIKTAQNISKTTRAMQMIAASKLKRAQHAALAARPYTETLMTLTTNLAPKKTDTPDLHPYLGKKLKSGKTLYIFIGPDKGLCGGMVTNLIREFSQAKKDDKASFVSIGKKLEGPVSTSKRQLGAFHFGTTLPSFQQVLPLVEIINNEYLNGDIENVKIVSTQFVSVFAQTARVIDLLPVKFAHEESSKTVTKSAQTPTSLTQTIFEPSEEELLPELLKRYIEIVLFQEFLESYASYNAAQMIAMQNATNNAKDIVSDLQLLYNKARQEKITKEILDISSAAVAMGAA